MKTGLVHRDPAPPSLVPPEAVPLSVEGGEPPDDDPVPDDDVLPEEDAFPDDDVVPDDAEDDGEPEEAWPPDDEDPPEKLPEDEPCSDEAPDPPLLLHPFGHARSKPRTEAGSKCRMVDPPPRAAMQRPHQLLK